MSEIPVDKIVSLEQAKTMIMDLRVKLQKKGDDIKQLWKKLDDANVFEVLDLEDENAALKKQVEELTAEIGRLKGGLPPAPAPGPVKKPPKPVKRATKPMGMVKPPKPGKPPAVPGLPSLPDLDAPPAPSAAPPAPAPATPPAPGAPALPDIPEPPSLSAPPAAPPAPSAPPAPGTPAIPDIPEPPSLSAPPAAPPAPSAPPAAPPAPSTPAMPGIPEPPSLSSPPAAPSPPSTPSVPEAPPKPVPELEKEPEQEQIPSAPEFDMQDAVKSKIQEKVEQHAVQAEEGPKIYGFFNVSPSVDAATYIQQAFAVLNDVIADNRSGIEIGMNLDKLRENVKVMVAFAPCLFQMTSSVRNLKKHDAPLDSGEISDLKSNMMKWKSELIDKAA